MIQREKSTLSIRKQCAALELARSTLHYAAKGESPMNLMLMRLIDEKFLQRPFLGVYRMKLYLRSLGHRVGEKRVRRLMRLMGLMAIYPKPNLSLQNKAHERYPYLLRDVRVGLQEYFSYYCHERPHRTLGDCTPFAVYQAGCERQSAA